MNDASEVNDTNTETNLNAGRAGNNQNYDLDLILDIPLTIRAELGQVKLLINDLLQLGQGSILELDKKVGDQLDIYISDQLVARGEVVVVEEKFGIRLTDIISPTERVRTLG